MCEARGKGVEVSQLCFDESLKSFQQQPYRDGWVSHGKELYGIRYNQKFPHSIFSLFSSNLLIFEYQD